MKRFLRGFTVLLAACISLAASCHHEPPDIDGPNSGDGPLLIDASYDIPSDGGSITINMTATQRWSAKVSGNSKWCTLDRSSGAAGEVTIQINISANDSYSGRQCTVTITTGKTQGRISIVQAQLDVLQTEPESLEIEAEGGSVEATVRANISYTLSCEADWLSWEETPAEEWSTEHTITISAGQNESPQARSALLLLQGGSLSCTLSVQQAGALESDPLDGIATALQTHSQGAGIPIVIMGDAFPREDIESGQYQQLMSEAAETLFSEEPFALLREMFDVYCVNIVSGPYEDFSSGESTTLGTWFGEGTMVGGDISACRRYTLEAIAEEDLEKSLTIVLMNRACHAGRCYMSFVHREDSSPSDCALGEAYAFLPLGTDPEDFASLLLHEAGGHGFGKLADEYAYDTAGIIPQSQVDTYRSLQTLSHAYMNVSFDSEELPWSHFLEDERYRWDGLGCWEGACTYPLGVWRPSENSIMNSAPRGFNAPSREAIYRRIQRLAFGSEWEYDFETFAAFDAACRTPAPEEPVEMEGGNAISEKNRPGRSGCVIVY